MSEEILIAQEGIAASNQSGLYLALLVLVSVVIAVLIAVVILQNRKIKDMQRPRYGFLGKTLSAFFAMAIMVGGFGALILITNRPADIDTAGADLDVGLNIIITQTSSGRSEYQFQAIPTISSADWGNDSKYKFDVYWTISGEGKVITEIENDLSIDKKGGFIKVLTEGEYRIKAITYIGNEKAEKELTLTVE